MPVPASRDPRQQGYPPAYRPQRGGHRPYPDSAPAVGPVAGAQPWVASPAGPPSHQVFWTGQSAGSNRLVFTIVMSVLGCLALLVALGYIALATGLSRTSVGFVLALVPLVIVLLGVRWLDRWEPEPRTVLLVALVWGAGVAVLSALIVNTSIQQQVLQRTQDPDSAMTFTGVLVAPIVEESVKGAGVLLLYIFRRRHIDGPVDGVVYAATVGAGFAFTENVLYFSQYAAGVGEVFLMRGLFSPFAHALFTSCIGIAIGMTARSPRRWMLAVAVPAGWLVAILLHGLWNGSAMIGGSFVVAYLAIHLPLFGCMVALLVWLRHQEARTIRERLTEYSRAGWFAPHEVVMLASLRLRSQAKSWAVSFGEDAKKAMVTFQREATRLALHRQRVRRHQTADAVAESALLEEIQLQRYNFGRAVARRS